MSLIQFEMLSAHVAHVTLDRPAKRNALNIEMLESLCGQIRRLETIGGCRVMILSGNGPVFCAGLDLVEAADVDLAKRSARWVAQTFRGFSTSPLVTIAAAHGAAMAGGAGLMSACDLAIAADDLKLGFPEVRRGLVPALVAKVLKPRLRDSEMRELFLLAHTIDAQRAQQIGLVQRVVPPSQLLDAAIEMADEICQGGPAAIRATKRLIRSLHKIDPAEQRGRSLEVHTKARTSDEAQEGLSAFQQRRPPRWMR